MNPSEFPADTVWSKDRPSQDEISYRAHVLWCELGCPHGHDVENWLEAERQLLSEASRRSEQMEKREKKTILPPGTPHDALAEEAPLATKVEAALKDAGRPASRNSATSLEL